MHYSFIVNVVYPFIKIKSQNLPEFTSNKNQNSCTSPSGASGCQIESELGW